MVITVTKLTFKKNPPKEIHYRDYKKFDGNLFKEELSNKLADGNSSYDTFEEIFISVLNKHAPLRKKILKANHAPYITKALRKAIMRRFQLQTRYFRYKSQNNYTAFKKQRNFCSKLYKKERKKYYNSLDTKNITDNKQFWKTIKPFLSEKSTTTSKIKLKDQDKIISNDGKVAEEFSKFFENAVKSLNIVPRNLSLGDTKNLKNPVEIAIKKFENHPSVQTIRENINLNQKFYFKKNRCR